jgi:hypothetical protein
MSAKTINEAEKNKYALFLQKRKDSAIFVLYDTQYLVELFHQVFQLVKQENLNLSVSDQKYITGQLIQNKYLRKMKRNIVISKMTVLQRAGVNEVGMSAAENDYGPLIYDIVMSELGSLVSDRHTVSASAMKIWKYYFYNRNDVIKTKIKNEDLLINRGSSAITGIEENCDILDHIFSLKNALNTSNLKNNHTAMMRWIERNVPSLDIESLGAEFFRELYKPYAY